MLVGIFINLTVLVQLFIVASIPLLIGTFGMLLIFYRVFHPWVSEGISVGFEPSREKHEHMMEDIYSLGDGENEALGKNFETEKASSLLHDNAYGKINSNLYQKFLILVQFLKSS